MDVRPSGRVMRIKLRIDLCKLRAWLFFVWQSA
jgi:hypothetical protein